MNTRNWTSGKFTFTNEYQDVVVEVGGVRRRVEIERTVAVDGKPYPANQSWSISRNSGEVILGRYPSGNKLHRLSGRVEECPGAGLWIASVEPRMSSRTRNAKAVCWYEASKHDHLLAGMSSAAYARHVCGTKMD